MVQVAVLPEGLVSAPGGDVGESLGEQVTRPVHEGRTITDRGDVCHVAVLVYQLIQYKQAATLVRGRDACDRGPPGPVYQAPVSDEFRISQRRLLRPGGKIVERSHLLQVGAEIAVIALVERLQRFSGDIFS